MLKQLTFSNGYILRDNSGHKVSLFNLILKTKIYSLVTFVFYSWDNEIGLQAFKLGQYLL